VREGRRRGEYDAADSDEPNDHGTLEGDARSKKSKLKPGQVVLKQQVAGLQT